MKHLSNKKVKTTKNIHSREKIKHIYPSTLFLSNNPDEYVRPNGHRDVSLAMVRSRKELG